MLVVHSMCHIWHHFRGIGNCLILGELYMTLNDLSKEQFLRCNKQ